MKEKLEQLKTELQNLRAKMRELAALEQRMIGACQVLEELAKEADGGDVPS